MLSASFVATLNESMQLQLAQALYVLARMSHKTILSGLVKFAEALNKLESESAVVWPYLISHMQTLTTPLAPYTSAWRPIAVAFYTALTPLAMQLGWAKPPQLPQFSAVQRQQILATCVALGGCIESAAAEYNSVNGNFSALPNFAWQVRREGQCMHTHTHTAHTYTGTHTKYVILTLGSLCSWVKSCTTSRTPRRSSSLTLKPPHTVRVAIPRCRISASDRLHRLERGERTRECAGVGAVCAGVPDPVDARGLAASLGSGAIAVIANHATESHLQTGPSTVLAVCAVCYMCVCAVQWLCSVYARACARHSASPARLGGADQGRAQDPPGRFYTEPGSARHLQWYARLRCALLVC